METTICKTKKQAILEAKKQLRSEYNLFRLSYYNTKTCACSCDCGESECVEVGTFIDNNYVFKRVGICRNCNN